MNQVKFLGLAHTFATVSPATFKTFYTKHAQERYGYSSRDKKFTVVREVLRNNLTISLVFATFGEGNKPKKFDFVHQTVSCREARASWVS